MNCKCQAYACREYITTKKQLQQFLKLTSWLMERGSFILEQDPCKNPDIYFKIFKCSSCGETFQLDFQTNPLSVGSFGLKPKITSEHLIKLDQYCQKRLIKELSRSKNDREGICGEMVYYDCYFDAEKIKKRFNLPKIITYFEYDGKMAGQESGFVDETTNDAILGSHPLYGKRRNLKKLE